MNKKINSDEVYFSIKDVADKIGVVPATIRNWEKHGLFIPKRSKNGYRIFNYNDIELLSRIREYSKEKSMGINAIKILYSDGLNNTIQENETTAISKKFLSQKWKESRLERGFLLEDVAKAIGISPSYLSKIENLQANVTLDLLNNLADFYGENVLYYVQDSVYDNHLVKKNTGDKLTIGIPGISIESLVATKNHILSSMLYNVEPGCGRNNPKLHTGEEFLYVLSGKIRFKISEDQNYLLTTGDSLSFNSKEPHSWYNPGKKVAKILWVYTPVSQK